MTNKERFESVKTFNFDFYKFSERTARYEGERKVAELEYVIDRLNDLKKNLDWLMATVMIEKSRGNSSNYTIKLKEENCTLKLLVNSRSGDRAILKNIEIMTKEPVGADQLMEEKAKKLDNMNIEDTVNYIITVLEESKQRYQDYMKWWNSETEEVI